MTIRKITFALPPDLRGQLWVAAGVPIGLAILARAMSELELAVGRRHEQLADLDAKIAAKTAEYGRLLIAGIPRFRKPDEDPVDAELVCTCNAADLTYAGPAAVCAVHGPPDLLDEPSLNGAAPAETPAASS